MNILDGKKTSLDIQNELGVRVKKLIDKRLKAPHLAAVLVGDNGASRTYVNAKVNCERVGFKSTLHHLDAHITQEELLSLVNQLNNDDSVDGFIVQLPLPDHIDENQITLSINPKKM